MTPPVANSDMNTDQLEIPNLPRTARRSSVIPIVESNLSERLRNRVALVTGGTRGIGREAAIYLGKAGCIVAVGYNGNEERAAQFQKEFAASVPHCPAPALLVKGDIGKPEDCRRIVQTVVDTFGRIDILVNNAGITIDRTVAKMQDEEWSKVIDVNLSGAFYMSQAALSHMVEQGNGRIIMLSSVIGQTGNIGQANYAASKSGLFGLTKSLAREACLGLAKNGLLAGNPVGITVNAVAPGFIDTEMTEVIPDKVKGKILSSIPCGRMGTAEEVARAIGFLASDSSAYINGETLSVNGGMAM